MCWLTALNETQVQSDLTNGPIKPDARHVDLRNCAIDAANHKLARTNRLLVFSLTSRPYDGKPEGADSNVGCPRVGADFQGVDVLLRGCVVNLAQLWDPCRKQ